MKLGISNLRNYVITYVINFVDTGPTTDHTLQSINGFYMYTEATGRKFGDKARLLGPVEKATTGQCLQFWYHMYGSNMGTLSVHLKINNVLQKTAIWSESGNKGNVWKLATKTITSSSTYQVGVGKLRLCTAPNIVKYRHYINWILPYSEFSVRIR